jgi:hypothetical protein
METALMITALMVVLVHKTALAQSVAKVARVEMVDPIQIAPILWMKMVTE